jgi:tetrahydromethanopterin S-methyltransferase subunit B
MDDEKTVEKSGSIERRNRRFCKSRWYSYGALIVILLWSSAVRGEECATQNYDSDQEPNFECVGPGEQLFSAQSTPPNSIPVREGQSIVAPWEGALVHRDRLINFGLKIMALRRLRWLDRLRLREQNLIEINYRERLAENSNGFNEQLIATCNQTVERVSAWYKSFWFGLTLGLIVGFGLTLGVTLAIIN